MDLQFHLEAFEVMMIVSFMRTVFLEAFEFMMMMILSFMRTVFLEAFEFMMIIFLCEQQS